MSSECPKLVPDEAASDSRRSTGCELSIGISSGGGRNSEGPLVPEEAASAGFGSGSGFFRFPRATPSGGAGNSEGPLVPDEEASPNTTMGAPVSADHRVTFPLRSPPLERSAHLLRGPKVGGGKSS